MRVRLPDQSGIQICHICTSVECNRLVDCHLNIGQIKVQYLDVSGNLVSGNRIVTVSLLIYKMESRFVWLGIFQFVHDQTVRYMNKGKKLFLTSPLGPGLSTKTWAPKMCIAIYNITLRWYKFFSAVGSDRYPSQCLILKFYWILNRIYLSLRTFLMVKYLVTFLRFGYSQCGTLVLALFQ